MNASIVTSAAALLTAALLGLVGTVATPAPVSDADPPLLPLPAAAPAAPAGRTVPPVTVRVVHYNIRYASHGLDAVLQDLRDAQAQIVLLNEVDDRTRTGGVDQVRYLAHALGMNAAYDGSVRTEVGLRGNAVLSRFPIRDVSRYDLPKPGLRPRGLMRVRLAAAGLGLDVWTTHLSVTTGKLAQARAISDIVGSPTCATILGGDMNARPDKPVNRALRTHLHDVWPRVGHRPGVTNLSGTKRIDYLYYDRTTPRSARVEPLRNSDHRAVVGTLVLDAAHAC